MKRNIALFIGVILMLNSCSIVDIYGRDKNEIYSIEGPFEKEYAKENNTPVTVNKYEIKNAEEKIEKPTSKTVEKPIEKIADEPKKEYVIDKPVVNDPSKYKEIKIFVAEEPKKGEKPVEKPVEKPIEEPTKKIVDKKNFTYTKEDYMNLKLNKNDEEILTLIKRYYKIIETYDIMLMKTKELVYKVRKLQDPDMNSTVILDEIHKMIKETKTRSFILAVNRVEKNRGLK